MSASTQDNQAPFDPTGYDSISGAQLKQLLDGMYPYTDKGLVVVTTDTAGVPDVPDATAETKWKNYIWLRVGATATTPYIWNENAGTHLDGAGNSILKWYTISSASIGVGTITNDMIANNTIQSEKIYSLSANKLTGSLPSSILETLVSVGSAAGGDLAGTYPDPTLDDNTVTESKIVNLAVTNAKLENASTTAGIDAVTKMKPNAIGSTRLRTNAGNTAVEWFVPNDLESQAAAVVQVSGNGDKYLKVNAGATAYELVTFPTVTLPSVTGQYKTALSDDIATIGTTIQQVAHDLVTVPKLVRATFVCISANLGYSAGDEIDAAYISSASGYPGMTLFANTTNVEFRLTSTTLYPQNQTGPAFNAALDTSKWKVRIHAWK